MTIQSIKIGFVATAIDLARAYDQKQISTYALQRRMATARLMRDNDLEVEVHYQESVTRVREYLAYARSERAAGRLPDEARRPKFTYSEETLRSSFI